MAKVPLITSPCPFQWNAAPQPGKDFCGQCQRRVHNLDGMREAQRRSFLAACNTADVCVAYTVKRAPRLAMLAAGFAAVASGAAHADSPTSIPTNESAPGTYCPVDAHPGRQLEEISVIAGSTLAGQAQQWVDADEAAAADRPDLPVIDAAEWLPTREEGSDADVVSKSKIER